MFAAIIRQKKPVTTTIPMCLCLVQQLLMVAAHALKIMSGVEKNVRIYIFLVMNENCEIHFTYI
jgi:hypothetical protein